MMDVHTILIDDARQALLREIGPVVGRKDLQEAFAAWLVPGAIPGLGIDGAVEVAAGSSVLKCEAWDFSLFCRSQSFC